MALSKRMAVPLAVIILAAAAGGSWFRWRAGVAAQASGQPTAVAQGQPAAMAGHVSLSPAQRVMANVATAEAMEQALARDIGAVGIVQYDQSRQAKVTAWVAGRIDRLRVNAVGAVVRRDQPIAELYSPDLLATQEEYLLAVKGREQLRNSPVAAILQDGDSLVQSARQRLLLSGVREKQIADLEKSGRPQERLPIYTPLAGIVIDKLVQQGQYVNIGDVLFAIADLSTVWVEIEVYENDFPDIAVGQPVEVRSRSYPDRLFHGRVTLLYPFLDPKTRTVRVRVEMPNPGMALKPEMFVNAVIKVPLAPALVVPVTAVLDSGQRQVVWIETAPGMFEPRNVQTGRTAGGMIQILSGIASGDKVAVSGGYLIDSESQLQGGGGQDHSQHTDGKPAAKAKAAAPASAPAGHEGHGTAPAASPVPSKPVPVPSAPPTTGSLSAPTGHEGHGAAPAAAPVPAPTGHEGHGGPPAKDGALP